MSTSKKEKRIQIPKTLTGKGLLIFTICLLVSVAAFLYQFYLKFGDDIFRKGFETTSIIKVFWLAAKVQLTQAMPFVVLIGSVLLYHQSAKNSADPLRFLRGDLVVLFLFGLIVHWFVSEHQPKARQSMYFMIFNMQSTFPGQPLQTNEDVFSYFKGPGTSSMSELSSSKDSLADELKDRSVEFEQSLYNMTSESNRDSVISELDFSGTLIDREQFQNLNGDGADIYPTRMAVMQCHTLLMMQRHMVLIVQEYENEIWKMRTYALTIILLFFFGALLGILIRRIHFLLALLIVIVGIYPLWYFGFAFLIMNVDMGLLNPVIGTLTPPVIILVFIGICFTLVRRYVKDADLDKVV